MSLLSTISKYDHAIILSVARWRSSKLTIIMKLATYSARGYAWALYVLLLFFLSRNGIYLIAEQVSILNVMICVFVTFIVGNIIKPIFKRKRPFQVFENFPPLVYTLKDDSFPSLHAGSTFTFWMALLWINHPWALWVGPWAVIVTFSRLYLGVHFLSDLLGGIILGIICSMNIYFF